MTTIETQGEKEEAPQCYEKTKLRYSGEVDVDILRDKYNEISQGTEINFALIRDLFPNGLKTSNLSRLTGVPDNSMTTLKTSAKLKPHFTQRSSFDVYVGPEIAKALFCACYKKIARNSEITFADGIYMYEDIMIKNSNPNPLNYELIRNKVRTQLIKFINKNLPKPLE